MNNHPTSLKTQLATATVLSLGGLTLLFLGCYFPPEGIIDNTVLVAFGEVATFAGALFGVDYRYKSNDHKQSIQHPKQKQDAK